MVLLLALAAFWWHLRSLDRTILQQRGDLQRRAPEVKIAEQWLAKAQSVQQWTRGDINWLEELRDISRKLPSSDQVRVEECRASVTPAGDGVVVLEGVVDVADTIALIEQNLSSERRRVRGEGGTYELRDEKYPWRFRETITILTADPSRPADATVGPRAALPDVPLRRGSQR